MSRTPPNAATLEWELFGLKDHRYGGLAPFFIDWFDLPAPGDARRRASGRWSRCASPTPDPAPLQRLVSELGLDVAVTVANGDAELTITFDEPARCGRLLRPFAGRLHAAR